MTKVYNRATVWAVVVRDIDKAKWRDAALEPTRKRARQRAVELKSQGREVYIERR